MGEDLGSEAWVRREVVDPVLTDLVRPAESDTVVLEPSALERPGWRVRARIAGHDLEAEVLAPTSGWWAPAGRAVLTSELGRTLLRSTWGADWRRARTTPSAAPPDAYALAVRPDFEDRRQAALVLAPYAGRPEPDTALRALLTDDDGYVVQAAAEALVWSGRASALELVAYGWDRDSARDAHDVCDALDDLITLPGPLQQRFLKNLLAAGPTIAPELRVALDDLIGALPRWLGDGGYPAYDGHRRADRPGTVVLVCGLPGSGKTTWAKESVRRDGGLRYCPDEWMWTLGMPVLDSVARARVEALQFAQALRAAGPGLRVVLENGFWPRVERDRIRERCRQAGLRVELVVCRADPDVLLRRVAERSSADPAAAPVTAGLLEQWARWFDDPDDAELALFDAALIVAG